MAISIKASNGYALLGKLGIAKQLINDLQGFDIEVKVTASAIMLLKGAHSRQAPVTLDQLQKLAAGSLSASQAMQLRTSVTEQIDGMLNFCINNAFEKKVAAPEDGALSKLPPLKVEAPEPVKPAAPVAAGKWQPVPATKMTSMDQVHLRDADKMYQPVFGTSPGSRYYVVAGGPDVRVAVRYQAQSLSIRCEGPKFSSWQHRMSTLGMKVQKDYASLHLNTTDEVQANKTLGAVLMGLAIPFETPMPDLKVVANK